MNRIVAVRPATVAAVKPIHATVIHLSVDRRVTPSTSRSGAAAVPSACFWTVAILRGSAYQNRAAPLNIVRGRLRRRRAALPDRLRRRSRRVPHAKVLVFALDLLHQRKVPGIAQQRD